VRDFGEHGPADKNYNRTLVLGYPLPVP